MKWRRDLSQWFDSLTPIDLAVRIGAGLAILGAFVWQAHLWGLL